VVCVCGEECDLPYLIDSIDQSAGFWSRRNRLDCNFLVSSPRSSRPLARAPVGSDPYAVVWPKSSTYRIIFYVRPCAVRALPKQFISYSFFLIHFSAPPLLFFNFSSFSALRMYVRLSYVYVCVCVRPIPLISVVNICSRPSRSPTTLYRKSRRKTIRSFII